MIHEIDVDNHETNKFKPLNTLAWMCDLVKVRFLHEDISFTNFDLILITCNLQSLSPSRELVNGFEETITTMNNAAIGVTSIKNIDTNGKLIYFDFKKNITSYYSSLIFNMQTIRHSIAF